MNAYGDRTDPAARLWYVRVSGTIYGPFDDQVLWTYVQEGRVTAQSELSLRPDTAYQAAQNWLEIAHWFQQPAGVAQVPQAQPEPEFTYLSMIMAEIRSGRSMAFLQTLQSLGDAQRIGDAVWLLRSNATPDQLKSVLGPTIAATDRLFIADATGSDHAAINLGPAIEAQLTDMFNKAGG